ncbi:MAG TPA: Uma2 family endonuclease, partial [Acidimicrobiales bacterium]|nr:Uma2 family endonuclease [Acidimicrobiales bacterium]
MATTTAARLTAEEYFVAAAGDPRPTQLIDGVIVPSQPKFRHQDITGLIYMRLRTWVESDDGFGVAGIPIDVIVDHYNVYAPDVWWLADTEHRSRRVLPRGARPCRRGAVADHLA